MSTAALSTPLRNPYPDEICHMIEGATVDVDNELLDVEHDLDLATFITNSIMASIRAHSEVRPLVAVGNRHLPDLQRLGVDVSASGVLARPDDAASIRALLDRWRIATDQAHGRLASRVHALQAHKDSLRTMDDRFLLLCNDPAHCNIAVSLTEDERALLREDVVV